MYYSSSLLCLYVITTYVSTYLHTYTQYYCTHRYISTVYEIGEWVYTQSYRGIYPTVHVRNGAMGFCWQADTPTHPPPPPHTQRTLVINLGASGHVQFPPIRSPRLLHGRMEEVVEGLTPLVLDETSRVVP